MSVNSGLKATKIKGQRKASKGREFQSLPVRGKKLFLIKKKKKLGELIKMVAEETTGKKVMQKLHSIGVFS